MVNDEIFDGIRVLFRDGSHRTIRNRENFQKLISWGELVLAAEDDEFLSLEEVARQHELDVASLRFAIWPQDYNTFKIGHKIKFEMNRGSCPDCGNLLDVVDVHETRFDLHCNACDLRVVITNKKLKIVRANNEGGPIQSCSHPTGKRVIDDDRDAKELPFQNERVKELSS
jgi:Zn finger protein HypA/HybF involved in hydrogenase expression